MSINAKPGRLQATLLRSKAAAVMVALVGADILALCYFHRMETWLDDIPLVSEIIPTNRPL